LAKASTAIGEPACRPEFVEGDVAYVDFKELRHPALYLRKGDFIPNDVKLGGDVGKIALLTGEDLILYLLFIELCLTVFFASRAQHGVSRIYRYGLIAYS
jgi:hypothetical protein